MNPFPSTGAPNAPACNHWGCSGDPWGARALQYLRLQSIANNLPPRTDIDICVILFLVPRPQSTYKSDIWLSNSHATIWNASRKFKRGFYSTCFCLWTPHRVTNPKNANKIQTDRASFMQSSDCRVRSFPYLTMIDNPLESGGGVGRVCWNGELVGGRDDFLMTSKKLTTDQIMACQTNPWHYSSPQKNGLQDQTT
jgi:hypothetical protein